MGLIRYLNAFAWGVIVAIALLPATSWVVRNPIDGLRYGGNRVPNPDLFGIPVIPANVTDTKLIKGDDPAADFAKSYSLAPEDASGEPTPDENAVASSLAAEYAEAHPNDPVGWAQSLRCACVEGSFKPDNTDPQAAAYHNLAARAASQGRLCDPDNAFFPLLSAAIHFNEGNTQAALADLDAAGRCPKYDDYIYEGFQRVEGVIEEQWGYRGSILETEMRSSITLPHLVHLNDLGDAVGKLPLDARGLKARLDLYRSCRLLEAQGNIMIDVLVGQNVSLRPLFVEAGLKRRFPGQLSKVELDKARTAALVEQAHMREIGLDPGLVSPTAMLEMACRQPANWGPDLPPTWWVTVVARIAIMNAEIWWVWLPLLAVVYVGLLIAKLVSKVRGKPVRRWLNITLRSAIAIGSCLVLVGIVSSRYLATPGGLPVSWTTNVELQELWIPLLTFVYAGMLLTKLAFRIKGLASPGWLDASHSCALVLLACLVIVVVIVDRQTQAADWWREGDAYRAAINFAGNR